MSTPDFVSDAIRDIQNEYRSFFAQVRAEDVPAVNDALRRLATNLIESGGQPTPAQNHTRAVILQELKNLAAERAVFAQKVAEQLAFRLMDRIAAHLMQAAL
jgi:hypothetical protein